jgi:uncharacterized protein (DUF1501 family)
MASLPRPPRGFSRRQLLRQAPAAGGLLAAFAAGLALGRPATGRAATTSDTNFIFCYFQGGWDLLLSLDPRDPSVFRDDLRKVTRIQCGYDQLDAAYQELVPTSVEGMVFGPAIGGLARHADKLCVVRGMSMDTLTHEVGRRRFLTGHPPAGLQATGSSLATVLAARLGTGEPVPQLSIGVESYNTDQASSASAIRVTSVDDLVRALRPGGRDVSREEQEALDHLLGELEGCDRFQRSAVYQDAVGYRDAAKLLVAQGLDDRFAFADETAQMQALRDLYGIDPTDLESAAAQCAAAVTAVTNGISRCVSIMPAIDLDQHGPEWSSAHAPRLEAGFDLVAAMIDDLAGREYGDTGESWLDHTVLVGFSEFGRSTLLNSAGGRDHYLHNACFLAGAGIRGGAVVGASSDVGMAPQAMDLATGVVGEGGETVRPEHVYRALLKSVGIEEDVVDYRVEPLTAILRT